VIGKISRKKSWPGCGWGFPGRDGKENALAEAQKRQRGRRRAGKRRKRGEMVVE
jgi:hypothetical protein